MFPFWLKKNHHQNTGKDPWSRRQDPIKVPRVKFTTRYPRLIPIGGGLLLASIYYSRFIYDAFLREYLEPDTVKYINIDTAKLRFGKVPEEERAKLREEYLKKLEESNRKDGLTRVTSP